MTNYNHIHPIFISEPRQPIYPTFRAHFLRLFVSQIDAYYSDLCSLPIIPTSHISLFLDSWSNVNFEQR